MITRPSVNSRWTRDIMQGQLVHEFKRLLRSALPGFYGTLAQWRLTKRYERLIRHVVARRGWVVQSGPFAGMLYVNQAVGSAHVPKLLGSYEAELHEIMRSVLTENYATIVDVGCAEGYYAIGLALRL